MNQDAEKDRGRCKTKTAIKHEEQVKCDELEEFGDRKTVRKHDLRQPSEQERFEHELTHLPFRS